MEISEALALLRGEDAGELLVNAETVADLIEKQAARIVELEAKIADWENRGSRVAAILAQIRASVEKR